MIHTEAIEYAIAEGHNCKRMLPIFSLFNSITLPQQKAIWFIVEETLLIRKLITAIEHTKSHSIRWKAQNERTYSAHYTIIYLSRVSREFRPTPTETYRQRPMVWMHRMCDSVYRFRLNILWVSPNETPATESQFTNRKFYVYSGLCRDLGQITSKSSINKIIVSSKLMSPSFDVWHEPLCILFFPFELLLRDSHSRYKLW